MDSLCLCLCHLPHCSSIVCLLIKIALLLFVDPEIKTLSFFMFMHMLSMMQYVFIT